MNLRTCLVLGLPLFVAACAAGPKPMQMSCAEIEQRLQAYDKPESVARGYAEMVYDLTRVIVNPTLVAEGSTKGELMVASADKDCGAETQTASRPRSAQAAPSAE